MASSADLGALEALSGQDSTQESSTSGGNLNMPMGAPARKKRNVEVICARCHAKPSKTKKWFSERNGVPVGDAE